METEKAKDPIVLDKNGETLYRPKSTSKSKTSSALQNSKNFNGFEPDEILGKEEPSAAASDDVKIHSRYYEVQMKSQGVLPRLLVASALILTPVLVAAGLVFTALFVAAMLAFWAMRSMIKMVLFPGSRGRRRL